MFGSLFGEWCVGRAFVVCAYVLGCLFFKQAAFLCACVLGFSFSGVIDDEFYFARCVGVGLSIG